MKQFFTSQKNYLKRQPISGNVDMPAPTTTAAWFNYSSNLTITHNLGYVPLVRVYYEPDASNGKVYPATGRRLAGIGPGLNFGDVLCFYEVNETILRFYLESTSAKTGTRKVYYIIYLDQS